MYKNKKSNNATIGFGQQLWQSADKLKNNMDAAETVLEQVSMMPYLLLGSLNGF